MIRADAAGRRGEHLLEIRGSFAVGAGTGHRPGCLCHAAPVGHGVDADDTDTGCNEQPDHQLSDQSEAYDAGRLAELRLGPPHALHGDGPDGREGGVLR